jgi:Flp pilus assembly protein protease CpaA
MYALLLSLPVAVLAVADLRKREVAILWLVVFGVLSAVVGVASHGVAGAAVNLAVNLLLLAYLAGGVLLYIRLRRGKWMCREYLGAGDVVFLAGAAPLFGLRSYLLFLLCAALFSLAWWAVARSRTIPFVATAGIVLIIALLL